MNYFHVIIIVVLITWYVLTIREKRHKERVCKEHHEYYERISALSESVKEKPLKFKDGFTHDRFLG